MFQNHIFNTYKTFLFVLIAILAIYLLGINGASAEDINVVFTDINTKTDSIMSWVTGNLVYFIALCAFIGWAVAMLFKKMSYVEGISILIIIILIGFSPTIVGFLIHKN